MSTILQYTLYTVHSLPISIKSVHRYLDAQLGTWSENCTVPQQIESSARKIANFQISQITTNLPFYFLYFFRSTLNTPWEGSALQWLYLPLSRAVTRERGKSKSVCATVQKILGQPSHVGWLLDVASLKQLQSPSSRLKLFSTVTLIPSTYSVGHNSVNGKHSLALSVYSISGLNLLFFSGKEITTT